MEFIQLPRCIQSADAVYDHFSQTVRNIRTEDVFGKIETATLKTIWCVTWAISFAFYLGRAAAEAYRTRRYADIRTEVCATPDADLDELVLPVLSMVASDIDVVELGAEVNALAALSAQQLRPLCQSSGIQWRNVRGHGQHLAKAEMIAALTS